MFLIIVRLLHKMIFNPPGTHKYTIQAWLKDSVEVKAERVEPQRVVLHPGGHDQDDHLLINQLEEAREVLPMKSKKKIVNIFLH